MYRLEQMSKESTNDNREKAYDLALADIHYRLTKLGSSNVRVGLPAPKDALTEIQRERLTFNSVDANQCHNEYQSMT